MVDIIINNMFGRDTKQRFQRDLRSTVSYDSFFRMVIKNKNDLSKIKLEEGKEKVLICATCNMSIYDTKLKDILTIPKEKLGNIYVVISPYFISNSNTCITKVNANLAAKLVSDDISLG